MERSLVFALGALGFACHHAPAPAAPDNVGGDTHPPAVLLTIATSPCMGACPIYRAVLSDDGSLVFEGIENTASKGEQRTTLEHATVEAIIEAFASARFFDLDDDGFLPKDDGSTESYGCSDTSHTEVTFTLDGRTRTLDDPHCVDTDLSRLEDRVLPMLQLDAWIGGRD